MLYKVERDHVGLVIPEDNGCPHFAPPPRPSGIFLQTIRTLICYNIVTGLQLLDNKWPIFCGSCEYAKAMHKCISKEQITPPAKAFRDKIHLDLWGPSSTSTISGCKYYVTFTDNYSCYTTLELLKSKV